ncbi:MAG: VanZ family protein [Flavobacteriales bacterium]|nr:VanZ family protein [Flavobacteriales bacterium]
MQSIIRVKNILLHKSTPIVWLLIITILSGLPGNKIPQLPVINFDKLVHVGVYFVFSITVLASNWIKTNNLKYSVLVIFFGVFYGGFMEICQHYIFINRSGSCLDFFANTIGSIFGVLFFSTINKKLRLKR